ncbi:MAG: hypothetical protein ACRD3S_14315 [Terracidiphilus sp.]
MPTRAERWSTTGLSAFYGLQTPTTPAAIRNVSSSGIYLAIHETLSVGQLLKVKIQDEGDLELSSELQITLEALVARQDEFGVGLAFIPPPGLDPSVWAVLVRGIAVLTSREQVVDIFRTLRTVLFLCRLCPTGAEEAIVLLDGGLDSERTSMLFKIAHAVEVQLAADPDAACIRAHPKVVASVLRNGSWAPSEQAMQLWIGLFLSSCSVEEPDDSNVILTEILIHLTPYQVAIYKDACERALASATSGDLASVSVVLSPDEITKLTGITDLARNAGDLAYLYNLGLMRKLFDFTSYREVDSFDITPSEVGLALYRHCLGQRSKFDPPLAAAAREHLEAFLPPPIPSAFENFRPYKPE